MLLKHKTGLTRSWAFYSNSSGI